MFGYIYKTLNLATRKIYIGQHRRREFDPGYLGSGTALKASIQKYGRDCFKCELIEKCATLEELNEREVFWIEKYQSRNPSVGYNLAAGGDQVVVGCTAKEIFQISRILCSITRKNVDTSIGKAKSLGLRTYNAGEPWIPSSNNSNEVKMIAADFSVVVSLYSANQITQTKYYSSVFGFPCWKYNLMVKVQERPEFIGRIKTDIESGVLLPEKKGVGFGTSGVFFETEKPYKNSSRMPLII